MAANTQPDVEVGLAAAASQQLPVCTGTPHVTLVQSALGETCRLLISASYLSHDASGQQACTLVPLLPHEKAGHVVQATACLSVHMPAWWPSP